MIHSNGDLFSTDRADSTISLGLLRSKAEMAFPVPVKMIFSCLRKKFNGSFQAFTLLNRFITVSYTYLDVYKRQVPNCMRPIINKKIAVLSELTEHTYADQLRTE